MNYSEIKRDLFTVNQTLEDGVPYCLAHCISADFGMFGGIVVEFNKRWNMKQRLIKKYNNVQARFYKERGFALPEEVKDGEVNTTVYNLITKSVVSTKPTYDSVEKSLINMRNHMVENGYTKLAIPTIGCGIDGLEWDTVRGLVWDTFIDTSIEVLVCFR